MIQNPYRTICIYIFALITLCAQPSQAQQQDSLTWRFEDAFHEIADMLDGGKPLSIKRAVFISEWAYLNGNLDYNKDICKPIKANGDYLRRLIVANHWEKYKTAKQIALCNFFFYPCSGNGKKPFGYDFSGEYPEDDWHYQLVSRTLKTHLGQCRSLPWTFKVLAEELDAKAYVAHGPRHCFIMYEDEDNLFPEDWVNVELTSHQYQPTFWIKEHFEIADSAVQVGTYLTPLTDIQTIACQLADLALSFYQKYHKYNEFTLKCVDKSLEYYPMNPTAIIIKGKSLDKILKSNLKENNGIWNEIADSIMGESMKCLDKLKATYWTHETEELRKKWSQTPEEIEEIKRIY